MQTSLTKVLGVLLLAVLGFCAVGRSPAAAAEYVPFEGEKSQWHDDFPRYDFILDEKTLAIEPFKRPAGEQFGIADPPPGKRRCVVVAPKQPAKGNPWSWQGCYWDHQPQTEVELLRRGFHIAYISANANLKPDKTWDAWYDYLTQKHGLAAKPAFIGMSRGGAYAYTWSTQHPDKVSCIYADNPGVDAEALARLGDLAKADVPILHVCGSIDPLLGRNSTTIETIYRQFGGRISVMIKEGAGHHPHSLRDPRPIADFISQSFSASAAPSPDYLGGRITHTAFYGVGDSFREFPNDSYFITCRGPWFSECYDRYSFELPGVEGAITVIAPKTAAAGRPWVYRADFVSPDSVIDLALLAAGLHIVTGPVPYNADGPRLEHWNHVYDHLIAHGFSKKPVLAGAGGAAGEAYAWAIANPDKVACIYAENPLLHTNMTRAQPLDGLAALAKAGVPILHFCGSLDPLLKSQTQVAQQRFEQAGGQFTLILKEGAGHERPTRRDIKPIVEFIGKHAAAPSDLRVPPAVGK